MTLEVIIYPTLPERGESPGDYHAVGSEYRCASRSFSTRRAASSYGWGPADDRTVLTAPRALWPAQWSVIASYDPVRSSALLAYRLLERRVTMMTDLWQAEASVASPPPATRTPFLVAAGWLVRCGERDGARLHSTEGSAGPKQAGGCARHMDARKRQGPGDPALGGLDFGRDFSSVAIHDLGPKGLHGHRSICR